MKKYLVEFIGTFFLTFTVGTSAVFGSAPAGLAALAVGLMVMAMIYAGAHISDAHYNPAITLGKLIRGRCNRRDAGYYVISQLLAAFVGGAAASVVSGTTTSVMMVIENPAAVVVAEFLFSFALVFVAINSITAPTNTGNSFYGLAIGGTYAAGILTVGSISFGAFNPAVSFMLVMTGKLGWTDSWMHFIPQVFGGLFAGFAFKALCPEDN